MGHPTSQRPWPDVPHRGKIECGAGRTVPAGATVNMVDYNNAAKAHDGAWYLAFNTDTAGGGVYQDVPVNAAAGTSFVATAWLSAQSGTATGNLCVWGLG